MRSIIQAVKAKRSKLVPGAVAVLAAVTVLLTGTFAWTSISQKALNEKVTLSNPGGRLHDDFDGTNKDVYVENFTDPENGGQPIYARIRLDEYMEIGPDAGLKKGQEGYDTKKAKSLVDGADINNPATWRTHIPGAANDPFHEYYEWKFGGSTIYMPTFNKNKDSLAADINGTFEGTKPGDDVHYDDYETYTVGQKKTGDAVYDADENDVDEGNIYTVPDEEHTAKRTLTATVMTMKEWQDAGSVPGPYWVYDDTDDNGDGDGVGDGWAYWAQAILPGEATGLLLDGIDTIKNPDGKSYYAINVVAQLATADDIGSEESGTGFYGPNAGKSPSKAAKKLLDQAVATKRVTGADGETYLDYGDNTFRLIHTDGSLDEQLICGGLDKIPGNTDDKMNIVVLDPPNATYGSKFLGPESDDSYQAVGPDKKLGTADDIQVWGNPTLDVEIIEEWPVDAVTISTEKEPASVCAGSSLKFTARVTGKGFPVSNQNVTWSVSGNNSNGTAISGTGQLIVASEETAESLTVTATSKQDPAVSSEPKTVLVESVTDVTVTAAGNATTVSMGKTLQFHAMVSGNNLTTENQGVTWQVNGNTSNETKIDENGLLTIASDERGGTTGEGLTVTATSVRKPSKKGTANVVVTVTLDDIEFYVIYWKGDQALLLSRYVLEKRQFDSATGRWRDSAIRKYLNEDWLDSNLHPELVEKAIETTIYTRTSGYGQEPEFDEASDKVFLLSEADVCGSPLHNGIIPKTQEYTTGVQLKVPGGSWKTKYVNGESCEQWWFRSPHDWISGNPEGRVNNYADVMPTGAGNSRPESELGIRPALWVDLTP